ncbi:MAG: hypothetical protein ACRCTQ_05215 [Brevinemataceae bacterium]
MKYILLFIILSSYSVHSYSQEINTESITNLSYTLIPQYELPKRYIVDNHTTLYPKENAFRRGDIVFFLAMPITLFLVQNLLNFINIFNIALGNYNSDLGRDNFGFTSGEWSFLFSSIFLIPLGVAVYDAVYVKDYPLIPHFYKEEIKEVRVNFNVYRVKF